MRTIAATILGIVLAVFGASTVTADPVDATATKARAARCATPAPTTAAGFTALFNTVPAAEFAAADVGVTVPLADGRSVWLWGDTMSPNRVLRHSTAITQDGGCLNVSHKGAQLLPNKRTVALAERTKTNAAVVYWIEAAREIEPGVLHVEAEEIRLFGQGVWDFGYTGYTATARVTVDVHGDLDFERWVSRTRQPAADPGDFIHLGEGHFGYSVRTHPEFTLASGKTLTTMAQNWDDGRVHPLSQYRVIFTERGEAQR